LASIAWPFQERDDCSKEIVMSSESFVVCDVCGYPIEAGDFAVAAYGLYFCSVECEEAFEELEASLTSV
jgi:YHS domain-containing protein